MRRAAQRFGLRKGGHIWGPRRENQCRPRWQLTEADAAKNGLCNFKVGSCAILERRGARLVESHEGVAFGSSAHKAGGAFASEPNPKSRFRQMERSQEANREHKLVTD